MAKITEFYPEKQGRPYVPPGASLDARGAGLAPLSVRGIHLAGEFSKTSKTDNYSAGDEMVILVDASGGTVIITLPPAATNSSKVYWIKNVGESGSVTIKPNTPTELIEEEAELHLTMQGQYVMIICSGTKIVNSYWHILGGINMRLEGLIQTQIANQEIIIERLENIETHLAEGSGEELNKEESE